MELRKYQREAIDSVKNYYIERKKTGNVLVVLPTGSGKSIVQAQLITELLEKWPHLNILACTHTKELIQQNYECFRGVSPHIQAGVYSAGLKSKSTDKSVIFCGIQSIYNKSSDLSVINVLIVDEAHLIGPKSDSRYQSFIDDLRKKNKKIRVIGLTATPYRRSGLLTEGVKPLFNTVVYEADIKDLVNDGYLSPLTTESGSQQIDTQGLRIVSKEYHAADLEFASDKDYITNTAIQDAIEKGYDRKSWLVFCTGIRHTEHVWEALNSSGVNAKYVTGKTEPNERDKIISDYKDGEIKCLVNANILTTGFNDKKTDLIIILRPTQSPGLYAQILGRGLRTHTSKKDCLVLDYGGNIDRHGPVDNIKIPKTKTGSKKGGGLPSRSCPNCYAQISIGLKFCPECDEQVKSDSEEKLELQASEAKIMGIQRETFSVDVVKYNQHKKLGRPDSLRVDYRCGLKRYSEWIALESDNRWAKKKSCEWWHTRTSLTCPSSVVDALDLTDFLKTPKQITVELSGKYPQIVGYNF